MHTKYDSAGWWSFDDDTARNIIFDVDNSSSSHSVYCKNNFFILGEGLSFGINESFSSREKNVCTYFIKANIKLCLGLHYNGDNSYLFVNGNEIFKSKVKNENANFPTFVSKAYLMDLVLLSLEKYL